jgi:hypothetical protein
MASNLLNTLEKIEKGRKKCIKLANEVNYPLPENASLEQIAQCINAQGYVDEYYENYKAWFSKDFSALPEGKLRLPDDLEKLGRRAFYYGENLNIIWPRNLKTIGEFAFYQSTFADKTLNIPETVTRIEQNAFDYCKNMTINIPSSVTYLGNNAFSHSGSSTVINFDGRVKNLQYTFGDGNSSGTGTDGVVNLTDDAIATIETIGGSTFQNRILSKVPWNSNTKFASSHSTAFQYCRWMCPVTLPKHLVEGVTIELSSQCFQGNEFTQGFEFEEGFPITTISSYCMSGAKFNNDVLRLPETLKTIGSQSCYGICKYNVTTPSNNSTPLDRIEVPNKDSVTIVSQSFNNAYYKNLIIYAQNLTMSSSNSALSMANSSTAQGNVVFLNMKTVPTITSNTFSTSNLSKGSAKVYIPDDLVEEAKAKQYWSGIASYIKPLSEWPLYSEYADDILPREEA